MKISYSRDEKKNTGTYILLFIALGAGVILGSAYLLRSWDGMGEGIRGYLDGIMETAAENAGWLSSFKSSFVSNLLTFAVIFIMGFFRFGFLGTGLIIIRKGFVTGFTAASFLQAYGIKGIMAMIAASPSSLATVPALLIFSAASVAFSMKENKFQKKNIFSYIFFAIFIISIFCAASLLEGFLTTTFTKWLIPKIL